jgi:hypothetical protein
MYKVERKPADEKSVWYEVMLSPFKTFLEAEYYIEKYRRYYPTEDQHYRISGPNISWSKKYLS